MHKIKIFFSWLVGFLFSVCLVSSIIVWICCSNYWFFVVFLCFCYLMSIFACIYVINAKKQIHAKICWLLLITILPCVGVILFFVFAINPLKIKQNDQYLDVNKAYCFKKDNNIINKIKSNIKPYTNFFIDNANLNLKEIYDNTTITIIENNTELFEKSIELIKSAKFYINIQAFIFDYSGFWTKIFFVELIKKANQGIKIRLIYDWVGCHGIIKKKIFKKLEKYGIEVACFNPSTEITMFKGLTNYRLHTKFIVVDGKIALYGGSNFADEYLSMSKKNCHWCDLNYLIQGKVILALNVLFVYYWLNFCVKRNKCISNQNILNDINLFLQSQNYPKSKTTIQFFSFEPNFNDFNFEKLLLNAIYSAKKTIKILSPYFCIPNSIISALKYCQKQGIIVEIIGHNHNDKYVQLLNREKYDELLLSNVKIYEYDGYLHSKCVIIDDEYVMTGSCNIDYRSIYLAYESELIIDDVEKIKLFINIFNQMKKFSKLLNHKFLSSQLNFKNKVLLKIINIGKCLF